MAFVGKIVRYTVLYAIVIYKTAMNEEEKGEGSEHPPKDFLAGEIELYGRIINGATAVRWWSRFSICTLIGAMHGGVML